MSLLFLEESGTRTLTPRRADSSTVCILLKRSSSMSLHKFRQALLKGFRSEVEKEKDRLGYASFKQYHSTIGGNIAAGAYATTRSHAAISLLSRIRGIKPPAPYSISLLPYYDAVIELELHQSPSHDQVAIVGRLIEDLVAISERLSTMRGSVRYMPFSDGASPRENPLHLVFLPQEPSGLSRSTVQQHWIKKHAAFVVDNAELLGMRRYRIVHTTLESDDAFDNQYGGVAFVEFDSLLAFALNMLNPNVLRFNNSLSLDEVHNISAESRIMILREYDMLS